MAAKYPEDALDSDELRAERFGLNCPICLEMYKDPKSLTCLHTFCEPCINSHVMKMKENGTLKDGIECPLCRKVTIVEKKDSPPEDWTKSLPANYALLSVIETVFQNERDGEKKIKKCQPCLKRNNSEKAESFCADCQEYLCNSCASIHNTFAVTQGHQLMTAENLATNLNQSDLSLIMTRMDRCEAHSKHIKFYCVDDRQLCCSSCVIITHRSCKDVVEIDKIAEIKGNQTLNLKLMNLTANLKTFASHFQKTEKEMNDQIIAVKDTIQSVREDLNKAVDAFEERLLTETAAKQKQKSDELSKGRIKCESLIAALECSLCTHESVTKHGSKSQIFIAMHKLEEQFTNYETTAEDPFSKLQTVEISLELEDQIQNILDPKNEMGVLTIKTSKPVIDIKPIQLELVASVDLKKSDDNKGEPLITGMDYLPDGRLVAVDNKNNKCLILDEENTLVGTCDLENRPLAVMSVPENNICITSGNNINTYKVNQDYTLVRVVDTINTHSYCFCITAIDDNTFAIGTYGVDKPAIIVSKTGEIQQFNVDLPNKVFGIDDSRCAYIKIESKLILTVRDEDTVYIFDTKEKTKVVIKDDRIKTPKCIAVGQFGGFFVSCSGTNTLVQISSAGQIINVHKLATMTFPYALCISGDQTKLAVSSSRNGNRNIQVFKLSNI